jgi:peptidoglycan hydrolase CwlO-like protein
MRLIKIWNLRIVALLIVVSLMFIVSCVSKTNYDAVQSQLALLQTQLTSTQAQLASLQAQLASTQEELKSNQAQLKLYKETFGASLYSGTQPRVLNGQSKPVQLSSNPKSTNPTWQQVEDFILADNTDKHPYVLSSFVCGDFAEQIHNNAEQAEIRAAFVAVNFTDNSIGHALNAFLTTDKGLVYVDCTGTDDLTIITTPAQLEGKLYGKADNYDKVAYVQVDKPLVFVSLGNSLGSKYSDYQQWQRNKQWFDSKLQDYNNQTNAINSQVEAYGRAVEAFNKAVETCNKAVEAFNKSPSDPFEYQRLVNELSSLNQTQSSLNQTQSSLNQTQSSLSQTQSSLNTIKSQLQTMGDTLGSFWQQLGTVESIEIYW